MQKSSTQKTVNLYTAFYVPHPGGIERYVYHLAKELKNLNYFVNIITTDFEGKGILLEKKNGICIFKLKSCYLLGGRFPIPYSLKEIREIFQNCYSNLNALTIVNTRFFPTTLIGLILSFVSKNKSIVVEHGSGHFKYENKLTTFISLIYEHLITSLLKLFRPKFYAVSEKSQRWLIHFGINRSMILSNGVDLGQLGSFSKTPKKYFKGDKVVFYAGRLLVEKGIKELVQAFNLFLKKHPNYLLVIAGSGELEDYLKQTSKNKLSKIKFLNLLSHRETIELLSCSTVYVNPSNYPEGMPTTVLEAASLGIPVITTKNGSVDEIVISGKNGYLLESGNVEQILEALVLFDKNRNRLKLGATSVKNEILKKYNWSDIALEFVDRELAEKK